MIHYFLKDISLSLLYLRLAKVGLWFSLFSMLLYWTYFHSHCLFLLFQFYIVFSNVVVLCNVSSNFWNVSLFFVENLIRYSINSYYNLFMPTSFLSKLDFRNFISSFYLHNFLFISSHASFFTLMSPLLL